MWNKHNKDGYGRERKDGKITEGTFKANKFVVACKKPELDWMFN